MNFTKLHTDSAIHIMRSAQEEANQTLRSQAVYSTRTHRHLRFTDYLDKKWSAFLFIEVIHPSSQAVRRNSFKGVVA